MKTTILLIGAFIMLAFAAFMLHSAIDAASTAGARRASQLSSLGITR